MNKAISTPRIEYLKVNNYRVLKEVELKNITPLTVFLGPNGSGKSTIFDLFAFLSDCFNYGLKKAIDKRGTFSELRTRGTDGPIEFKMKYREKIYPHKEKTPLITYYFSINKDEKGHPFVEKEWLRWKIGVKESYLLNFENGSGTVVSGNIPDEKGERLEEKLESREFFAVNTLGQFAKYPRLSSLRNFITEWHLSLLSVDRIRIMPDAGPQERLSLTGENLPNVIQYLKDENPGKFKEILDILTGRIPQLEKIDISIMQDGRLLLELKDKAFERPVLSKYASDGTLKMLAYLILLYNPSSPRLIGIEEPENHLHPKLLPEFAEECIKASSDIQLFLTTHSPFFINELNPEQVWLLYRDMSGYAGAVNTSLIKGVTEMVSAGGKLGDLWIEGFFRADELPLEPENLKIGKKRAS